MKNNQIEKKKICPRCKKVAEEVGHYARDYTNLCSKCFAKGFKDI
jgi:hypothetical protein